MKELGSCDDPRCKQNSVKKITRRVCKHNCKHWNYETRKCGIGY